MIWLYILTFFAGVFFGILLMALMAASSDSHRKEEQANGYKMEQIVPGGAEVPEIPDRPLAETKEA